MTKGNKQNLSGSNIIVFILAILAALMIAAYCCISVWQKTWDFTKWEFSSEKQEQSEQPLPPENPEQSGGLILPEEVEGNGIKLVSTEIPADKFGDYAVPHFAEKAFTLTATITPPEAVIQTGKFTMAFENPSSEWATGKDCGTYISMQQSGLQATISCLQAFGEKIIVTFKSDDESCDRTASCILEYEKKFLGFNVAVHVLTKDEATTQPSPSTLSYTDMHDGEFLGTASFTGNSSYKMIVFKVTDSDNFVKFSAFTKDNETLTTEFNITVGITDEFKQFLEKAQNTQQLAANVQDYNVKTSFTYFCTLKNLNRIFSPTGSATVLPSTTAFNAIKSLQSSGKHPFVLKIEHPSSGTLHKYYFDLDTTSAVSVQDVGLNETTHTF